MLPLVIALTSSCRQYAQQLALTLPRNPFEQVSYQFAPSRKENEKPFQRRHLHGRSDGNRRTVLPAHDPIALGHWYQEHLGVSLTPSSYEEPVWRQQAGPTAFSPFLATSDYFGGTHKDWIVNFRVRDLDKMATQLQAAGIAVRLIRKSYPNGRFARLHDLKEILSNWATRETSPSLGCYNSSGLFQDLSWLGGQPFKSPAMAGLPNSAFAIYYCSAAHQLLQFFGVTSALHRDP
jgi:glyoxylase I family protein